MATIGSIYNNHAGNLGGVFKQVKNYYFSMPVSTITNALNNAGLPAGAKITSIKLEVTARIENSVAGNFFLTAGFGTTSDSIGTVMINGAQITNIALTGSITRQADILGVMTSTTAPYACGTHCGAYFNFNIHAETLGLRAYWIDSVYLYVETHTHSYTSTITVNPTCTTEGVRTYTCSCGKDSYTEPIGTIPHNYVATNVVSPSGTSYGYTLFECTNGCGSSEQRNLTYNVSAKAGTGCKYINIDGWDVVTEGNTMSHNLAVGSQFTLWSDPKDTYVFDKWVIQYGDGTKTEDTRKDLPVTLDANISAEAIYKHVHTEVIDAAKEPTCTSTGLTEGKHCSTCGEVFVAQTVIPALGHNYVPTVVSPTEDSHGYTRYDCSRCGHSYVDENSYTYLVRWYSEDGSELLETDPSVPYGTMPEYNGVTPTKAATAQYTYEHFGWNISPTAEDKIELTPVIANVNYYARFKATTIEYLVTWLDEDGTPLGEEAEWVPYGEKPSYDGPKPTKPDSPNGKYRYEFLGWSVKDVDDGYYDESELEPVTGHITYEAVYTPIVKQYHLSFITDDCAIEMTINDVPVEGDIDGYYDYGTFFRLKIVPDFGYEAVGVQFIDPNGDDSSIFPGDTLIFMVTQDEILKCVCERLPTPFFINPEQQVRMVYVVPVINTIVYQVEGDLPELEVKIQSVDGWHLDVVNTDMDEKYGLYAYYEVEQLYMNDGKTIINERIW